jgi:hypothetical protein
VKENEVSFGIFRNIELFEMEFSIIIEQRCCEPAIQL